MPNQSYPVVPELRIKTDVLSTDSAAKLSSIQWYVGSDGVAVDLTSADFGSSGSAWGVFEPRTSRQEFFKWTVSTIANGTTTGITISARGLPWGSDYTSESSARKFSHPAGSKVLLFTDYGGFWNTFANKANTETVTGVWTYSATPVITNAPVGSTDAANKAYVDGVAITGAPDASTTVKGIVEIATGAELAAGTGTGGTGAVLVSAGSSFKNTSAGAGDANKVPVLNASGVLDTSFLPDPLSRTANQLQITSDADSANDAVRQSYLAAEVSLFRASGTSGEAITTGDALYVKASDGKLWKCDADADESSYSFVGFALNTTGAADLTQYYSRPGGIATGLSGLTTGTYYYLSSTAGAISATPNATRFAKVAQALSTTTVRVIEPKFVRTGSQAVDTTTTYVQTCGFYPARIEFFGSDGSNRSTFGDDRNVSVWLQCSNTGAAGAATSNFAYNFLNASAAYSNRGTVSAKSATGFTLDNTNSSGSSTVYWTAYSE